MATAFDPRTASLLLVPPPNYARINQGATVTASSTATGFAAADMGYDDGGSPWRSGSVDVPTEVTIDLDLGQSRTYDFAGMAGTNLIAPFTIERWNGDPDGGGALQETVASRDSVVRASDASISTMQQDRVDEKLSIAPYRWAAPISNDWIRWKIDVTNDNGADDFLQVAYLFVGTALDFAASLDEGNQVTARPLSTLQASAGGRSSALSRVPIRSQTFAIQSGFEGDDNQELAGRLTMVRERSEICLIWRTPSDLESFARDGFFGTVKGAPVHAAQKTLVEKISGFEIVESR